MKLTKNFFTSSKSPFFLLRKNDESKILFCNSEIARFDKIDQIPLNSNTNNSEILDSVSLVPFLQAKERGFEVHDDGEKILTILIDYPLCYILISR